MIKKIGRFLWGKRRVVKRVGRAALDAHEDIRDCRLELREAYRIMAESDPLTMEERRRVRKAIGDARDVLGRYQQAVDKVKDKLE